MNGGPGPSGRLLGAFAWNAAGSFLRAGSGFLLGVILGRLLGPQPFGLVAAALLPIGLGQLLVDQGVSAELVQRPRIDPGDLRRARNRQLIMGAGLGLTLALTAPLLAAWYRMPPLRSVLWVLAPLFLVQALAQVPMALLKRHLRFRRLQAIQVGSYLVGYLGLGVPLALAGLGVWALVLAQWLQFLVQTGLLLLVCPEAHDHPGTGEGAFPEERAFAWRVMATNLANWGITNLAPLLIGRQFGAVELGLYNRGRNLIQSPTGVLMMALQGTIFPATAELQRQPAAVRGTFLGAVRTLAWLALPFTGCALAWSGPLVLGLYGPAWVGAVPLLAPLLVALPFTLLMGLPGPVLLGIGVASAELRVQVGLGLITLPLLALGGRLGLYWLLWMVVAVEVLRWFLMTRALLPRIGASWTDYLWGLAGPVAVGGGAFGLAWILEMALARWGLSPGSRLLAEVVAAGVLGACIWAWAIRRGKAPVGEGHR